MSASHYLVVTIDGPAGSGKSTVARLVARALKATFLDTGAIYRALALSAERSGIDTDNERQLAHLASRMPIAFRDEGGSQHVLLDGEDVSDAIRAPHVSQGASEVSRWPLVRQALLQTQRDVARQGAVVAEGRDTGTVVFPDAQVKVFLVADEEVRAQRRHAQLRESGREIALSDVIAEQRQRDARDSGRLVAPLLPADDAVRIDTTQSSIEQVVAKIVELCARRREELAGGHPARSARW
jgi:cytidylate kinase